ncbi:MAG: helix-turn-helix domain-containing protein [Clostridium sp.]|nr:MAG: helix-turn-helix domain-containing protein [Clostridium sp.]
MNVSKASKMLYLHRNTLIYKLDRFYEITGYDIRKI